nr:MAG TPA: hypothetical protein [Caudoviricetes sp.]
MRFLPKAVYDIQFERNHAKRDLKFSSLFFTCKFFCKGCEKRNKRETKSLGKCQIFRGKYTKTFGQSWNWACKSCARGL